jgi:glycerol-3-phosphate dehydrogenase (NAD(P)+)
MMRDLRPFLHPYHILIHGTKGLDISLQPEGTRLNAEHIRTMSQVIQEESVVCRVGCLSGPNLSTELIQHLPAATLIASRFSEVIKLGQKVLRSHRFQVYGNYEIIGAELAGALKNIIALAAGIIGGRQLGKNLWSLLITRGIAEMIHIGKAMGADMRPFLGVAGIGDLVATASSEKSRNYQVGYRLAKGETLDQILGSMTEVAEGIRTLATAKALIDDLQLSLPIIEILHRVFFRNLDLDRAINILITYPYEVDVDYLQ